MKWTPTTDEYLRAERLAGRSWNYIAGALGTTVESARKRHQRLFSSIGPKPSGWTPGVEFDGTKGVITSRPSEGKPDWDALIRGWGFDPAEVQVVEPVQIRTWDVPTADGVQTMRYHRAALVKRRPDTTVDLEPLLQEVARHRPHKPAPVDQPLALVIPLSDWQLGKGGTAGAVARILQSMGRVEKHLSSLRKGGRPADRIYLLGLGDIVESCDGHYPMQSFESELSRRDQERLARQLILKWVTTLAPLTNRMVVAAIGGNHGENRKDGKAFTTFGDNSDVAVFESVGEVVAFNPAAYGHVEFVIPKDELTMVLDVCGTKVGIAHGHQFGSGEAQVAARKWWSGQAFGQHPIGEASVLVSGHRHHFSVVEEGGRVHIQAPTQDSGSPWFEQTTGRPSRPGQLVFTVDENGWCGDATVLR